jgi:hypothetical protein
MAQYAHPGASHPSLAWKDSEEYLAWRRGRGQPLDALEEVAPQEEEIKVEKMEKDVREFFLSA